VAKTKKKILITAGPTREMLDPVRFLSNLSTGEMGYALARAAAKKKYPVTLVSGPTALNPPAGVRFVPICSTSELKKVLVRLFPQHDVLIMSAAVCDFTAAAYCNQKIKRAGAMTLRLKKTPDILAGLPSRKGKRLVIGFCLETSDWLGRARRKMRIKNLDGIVANYYKPGMHNPFGNRRVTVALLDRFGTGRVLRSKAKSDIARQILGWIEDLEAVRSRCVGN
jgi:phosphopantothenoylcysteine decarboxylase/phosphopantothenate--cysteine ligase